MTIILQGKARGKTIELNEDLGLIDGEEIEIQITTKRKTRPLGDGLLRTEGALANDPEWDQIMHDIYLDRKRDTRRDTAL